MFKDHNCSLVVWLLLIFDEIKNDLFKPICRILNKIRQLNDDKGRVFQNLFQTGSYN